MASQPARRHLSWLAAVLLLLMGFNAWLGIPGSCETGGIIHGASYVDVYRAYAGAVDPRGRCLRRWHCGRYQTVVPRLCRSLTAAGLSEVLRSLARCTASYCSASS